MTKMTYKERLEMINMHPVGTTERLEATVIYMTGTIAAEAAERCIAKRKAWLENKKTAAA